MKKFIRKIAAVGATVSMIGMTVGGAVAADLSDLPAPFVSGGDYVNTAFVVGDAAAGNDDAARTTLTGYFGGFLDSTTLSGENVKLEKASNKFNLGDGIHDVWGTTSITDSHLPTVLADGTYKDDNNNEFEYTQKIALANLSAEFFADSDYNDKEPTLGFHLTDNTNVLNYTLDFRSEPDYTASALETTDLEILGNTYFISDIASNGKITLLDSADSAIVSEGSSITVEGKTVSIEFIGSSSVKLNVDGEVTNSLSEGSSYKLNDGSYVVVKDIMYDSKDSGVSKVEIALGSGKLELQNGATVQMNDDDVEGLTAYITNSSGKLGAIKLVWTTDDEAFLTEDSSLVMPGFGKVMLTMDAPVLAEKETIKLENDGSDNIKLTAPLEDGTASFDLLYYDGSSGFTVLGKDSDNRLVTSSASSILFNITNGDDMFVATWKSGDDAESYLLSASVTTSDSTNVTTIKNEITGTNECENLEANDQCTIGSMTLTINSVYRDGSNKWVNISGATSFKDIYTKEGLKIALPYDGDSSADAQAINLSASPSAYNLSMTEEDKDGTLANGNTFKAQIGIQASEPGVNSVSGLGTGYEIDDTDVYKYYVTSDLATSAEWDKSGDQYDIEFTYNGEEAYFNVYVAEEGATSTPEPVLVKDNAASGYDNLILVGGPCVNQLTAEYMGLTYPACGDASTIAADQAIVKLVEKDGKTALIVAGWEQADTQRAASKVAEGGLTGTEVTV